jgi:parallel beta-helix repeat protein
MKTKRALFYVLAHALVACALSLTAPAQNVQTTDERISTPTGDRVCVANQKAGANIGAKIAACDSALGASKGVIEVYGGGDLGSTTVIISENHRLNLHHGTYTSTSPSIVMALKDGASVVGDGAQTVMQESTAAAQTFLSPWTVIAAHAVITNDPGISNNLTIRNLKIVGANASFNSAPQTIALANCHSCLVENVTLDHTRTIGIQSGGNSANGNFAQDVEIRGCTLVGVASQGIAVVNSRYVRVHDNVIRAPGDPNGPGNVPIDIEPNTGDTLRYVYVYNNYIDASQGATNQFGTVTLAGIAVQGGNTSDFRDVFIHNNTITGHTPNFDGYMISSGCILLRTARGVHVTDNNVSFCGYAGIALDYQSNNNQILRNTITSSGFNPAISLLVDSSSNNEVKFNKISIDPREAPGLIAGEDTLILEQSVTSGTADFNDFEGNLADVALGGGGHSKNYLNTPPSTGATSIPNFSNAQHTHTNAAGGGQLGESALALSDVTTNNVSTARHGFVPKAPNDTTKFLRGDGTWAAPPSGGTPSGWTDDGTVVRLTTSTDLVGIGTSSPASPLDVQTPFTTVNGSGVRFQQTLTAGNNNAVLNGLFINPSFSDGLAVNVTHNALVTGAGHIGFGTSSTGAALDVQTQPLPIYALNVTYGTRFQQTLLSSGNNGTSTAVLINPTFSDGFAVGVKHNGLVVTSGNVGFGTSTPNSKLQVTGGDVYVNSIGSGVIIRSPNGSCFRITVSDTGVLSTTGVGCP